MWETIEDVGELLIDRIMALFPFLIVIIVLISIAGTGWLIWQLMTPKESYALPVMEWDCVGTKPHISVVYVQSGKVMIPVETRIDECVQYQRKF